MFTKPKDQVLLPKIATSKLTAFTIQAVDRGPASQGNREQFPQGGRSGGQRRLLDGGPSGRAVLPRHALRSATGTGAGQGSAPGLLPCKEMLDRNTGRVWAQGTQPLRGDRSTGRVWRWSRGGDETRPAWPLLGYLTQPAGAAVPGRRHASLFFSPGHGRPAQSAVEPSLRSGDQSFCRMFRCRRCVHRACSSPDASPVRFWPHPGQTGEWHARREGTRSRRRSKG